MTFTGTVSAINAALDGLAFNGDPFRTGTLGGSQIVTDDLGNTGIGAKSDSDSVAINMIAIGTPYMISGTYTGTSGNLAITGLGFQPDVVIVKETSNNKVAVIATSAMPAGQSKTLSGVGTMTANQVVSIDGDGFTVGQTNANVVGQTFTWVAFKAAAGVMTVGSYTGNATAGKTVTGLGFSPELVYVMDAEQPGCGVPLGGRPQFAGTSSRTTSSAR